MHLLLYVTLNIYLCYYMKIVFVEIIVLYSTLVDSLLVIKYKYLASYQLFRNAALFSFVAIYFQCSAFSLKCFEPTRDGTFDHIRWTDPFDLLNPVRDEVQLTANSTRPSVLFTSKSETTLKHHPVLAWICLKIAGSVHRIHRTFAQNRPDASLNETERT